MTRRGRRGSGHTASSSCSSTTPKVTAKAKEHQQCTELEQLFEKKKGETSVGRMKRIVSTIKDNKFKYNQEYLVRENADVEYIIDVCKIPEVYPVSNDIRAVALFYPLIVDYVMSSNPGVVEVVSKASELKTLVHCGGDDGIDTVTTNINNNNKKKGGSPPSFQEICTTMERLFEQVASLTPEDVIKKATSIMKDIEDDTGKTPRHVLSLITDPFIMDVMRHMSETDIILAFFYARNIVPVGLDGLVEVGHSPRNGNGVFARKRIKKGTPFTTYPVHCMSVDHSSGRRVYKVLHDSFYKPFASTSMLEAIGFDSYLQSIGTFVKSDYKSNICVSSRGDVHPSSQCAHIINDGAFLAPDPSKDEILAYATESFRAQNCVLVSTATCIVAVACRDVEKGEELFTGYGPVYWQNQYESLDAYTAPYRPQRCHI